MASINKHIPLYPLLLLNFIGTLGFSIVLPFLIFLVIDFGGNAGIIFVIFIISLRLLKMKSI